jgi:hypothetical protein
VPSAARGRLDQAQLGEAGTVESSVAGEQRVRLPQRMGADEEIGDDAPPGGRAPAAVFLPRRRGASPSRPSGNPTLAKTA